MVAVAVGVAVAVTDLNTPLPAIQIDDGPRYFVAHLGAREERMTLAHLLAVLAALPEEQRREVIGQALGITGLGGFETDPRDSAALLELRAAIDDYLEWETPELEEEADYVANVRRAGVLIEQQASANARAWCERDLEKERADKAESKARVQHELIDVLDDLCEVLANPLEEDRAETMRLLRRRGELIMALVTKHGSALEGSGEEYEQKLKEVETKDG